MSLELAIHHARLNPIHHINPKIRHARIAAVIMNNKRIISVGFNQMKTHPLAFKFSSHPEAIYIHAELAALMQARCDVSGMTMYIARIDKNDQVKLAKPCNGCQKALIAYNLKNVHWTV